MTRYFVDAGGNYRGGYDGAEPPAGLIEVPLAPENARQIWNGTAWGAPPDQATLDTEELNAALTAPGSVLRALAELQFEEANRVRGWLLKPLFTRQQFLDALKAKMR